MDVDDDHDDDKDDDNDGGADDVDEEDNNADNNNHANNANRANHATNNTSGKAESNEQVLTPLASPALAPTGALNSGGKLVDDPIPDIVYAFAPYQSSGRQ